MQLNLNWKIVAIIIIVLAFALIIAFFNVFANILENSKSKINEVSGTISDINGNILLIQTDEEYILKMGKIFYADISDTVTNVNNGDRILIKYKKMKGYPPNIQALSIEILLN